MGSFENYQQGLLGAEAFGRVPDPEPIDDLQNLSPSDRARFHVMVYVNRIREENGQPKKKFAEKEVLLVWFCKTLKNWKAMVITTLPDQMYYEVTYNGETHETYIDAYTKLDNVCIPD